MFAVKHLQAELLRGGSHIVLWTARPGQRGQPQEPWQGGHGREASAVGRHVCKGSGQQGVTVTCEHWAWLRGPEETPYRCQMLYPTGGPQAPGPQIHTQGDPGGVRGRRWSQGHHQLLTTRLAFPRAPRGPDHKALTPPVLKKEPLKVSYGLGSPAAWEREGGLCGGMGQPGGRQHV